MIELAKHIEILLLTNNCVIVPGLGGFITHHVPSRWVEDEGVFLPPYRVVGFNPQLKINDGLLAQSYVQAYDANFPEANRLVDLKAKELLDILRQNGTFALHGIGTLSMNIEGKVEFSPNESGALSPSLYGLGSFQFPELKAIEPETTNEATESEENNETIISDNNRITIRVKRRVVNNVIAVAAAILLFFFMSTPPENTYVNEQYYAAFESGDMFSAIKDKRYITSLADISYILKKEVDKAINEAKAKKIDDIKNVELSKVTKNVETKKEAVKEQANSTEALLKDDRTKGYCLVLASHVTKSNANDYIKKLSKQGIEARILEKGKIVRVVCMNFNNESKAQSKLNELRKSNKEFKDSWVYQVK